MCPINGARDQGRECVCVGVLQPGAKKGSRSGWEWKSPLRADTATNAHYGQRKSRGRTNYCQLTSRFRSKTCERYVKAAFGAQSRVSNCSYYHHKVSPQHARTKCKNRSCGRHRPSSTWHDENFDASFETLWPSFVRLVVGILNFLFHLKKKHLGGHFQSNFFFASNILFLPFKYPQTSKNILRQKWCPYHD